MDSIIIASMKDEWTQQKKDECKRAYDTCVRLLKTPISYEEFITVWYDESEDKKGVAHIANMCMSIFQSRKANAGNGLERTIEKIHTEKGIHALYQKWVDSDGNIYDKKPKKAGVHKMDALIPTNKEITNTSDMYVVSMKTTLRERFRQDLDGCPKCKKVIFLTRETLLRSQIDMISGYNCIVVYPFAENTEHTWSFDKYFSEIKSLQDGTANSTC
jgi:hypothetical protein